ncbi:hypothetical protein [Hymenobacter weizhouensis]|uniref:hypothetical protein n=1 Tax=Hymenobacter sp. YIM 151500-1 TaxID=2987689 RepID=UPI0022260351|nr:hypothetical protein [Hymenobacter sp. YIM 151500-1]UYZ64296.1 hypothetical protein OIS53_05460 [Hymenobacter sp. YIM 151500-1]
MYQNEFAQEFEQALSQEQEYGSSQEVFEFNPEFMGELSGEQYELNGEQYEQYELGEELNETQEMELAHELLEVTNEQELNMFLGKLIKGAGSAIRNFANSPIGRGIGGALKTVAKTALPVAGTALGTFVGGPIGGMIGGKLGSAASNLFELELEGLSPEDQEFETARAFVRFANSAARRGAGLQRQRPGLPPQAAVRTALGQAARRHAPGLLRRSGPPARDARGRFTAAGRGRTAGRRPTPGGSRGSMRPGLGGARIGVGPNFSSFSFGNSFGPVAANGSGGYSPGPDDGYDADSGADYNDDDFGPDDSAAGYGPAPQRATRGTWQRRGRTLIIQL